MLPLVVSNIVDYQILLYIFTQNNLKFKLFNNNFTPQKDSIITDFIEPTIAGYQVITIDKNKWVYLLESNVNQLFYPQIIYNFSEEDDIYGWFLTDLLDSQVLLSEKFSTVLNTNSTKKFRIQLRMVGD